MSEMNFLQDLHTAAKRDYFARMNAEKPECMKVAKQFSADYWDGDRKFGYGGMKYDGRYESVAKKIVEYYGLKPENQILDIGAGKGFLLHDLRKYCPHTFGIDISEYAIANSICGGRILKSSCMDNIWFDKLFDFTYSINTFHNLGYSDLKKAIREMVRVTKPDGKSYICVESFRNEEELTHLQCWALTCLSFYSPDDWKQILEDNGYQGDIEFIFFS